MINMKPLVASMALCCALATGTAYAQTAPPTAPASPEPTSAPMAGGAMQQEAAPQSSGATSDHASGEMAKPAKATKPAKHKKHTKKAAAANTDPNSAPASGDATH